MGRSRKPQRRPQADSSLTSPMPIASRFMIFSPSHPAKNKTLRPQVRPETCKEDPAAKPLRPVGASAAQSKTTHGSKAKVNWSGMMRVFQICDNDQQATGRPTVRQPSVNPVLRNTSPAQKSQRRKPSTKPDPARSLLLLFKQGLGDFGFRIIQQPGRGHFAEKEPPGGTKNQTGSNHDEDKPFGHFRSSCRVVHILTHKCGKGQIAFRSPFRLVKIDLRFRIQYNH